MLKLGIFMVIVAGLGKLSAGKHQVSGAGKECLPDSEGIPLFPHCSVDSFIDGALRCVKVMGKGFPYNRKNQCLGNMDDMIGCMTGHVRGCLQPNCTSIITTIDGIDTVLPIINDILNKIKSLDDIYSTIDGFISDILKMANIQLPDGMLNDGVKNIKIPLSPTTQLTVHEMLSQVACPKPGQMPDFLKPLLPAVNIADLIKSAQLGNTTNQVPFCDADFVSYIANNGWQYLQDWFGAANRAEYCRLQKSFAAVLDNLMFKKCDLSHVFDLLRQVPMERKFMRLIKSVIKRVKRAPAILLDINGCLVSMDVKLKFKQKWNASLANETSDAYKAASMKATEALQMMMGTKKDDLLTVVWSFDEEGVATASVPLMGDESVLDMQRQFESFDVSQVSSLAQISVEPTPGNSGSILQQLWLLGYLIAAVLPAILWMN